MMLLFLQNQAVFIYFSIALVLTALSSVAAAAGNSRMDNVLFVAASTVMTFFYGFRFPGTPDIIMYLDAYDHLGSFSDFPWGGYTFYAFMKALSLISTDHDFFIFASSVVFVVMVGKCVYSLLNDLPYKSLAMISFMCGWFMLDLATNTYRQGLAMPLVMMAFLQFYKRNLIYAIIYSIAAIGMHWGALIPLAIGFASLIISRRPMLVKFVMISSMMIFTLSFFINMKIAEMLVDNVFISIIEKIFIGVNITTKVYNYLNADVDGAMFYTSDFLRQAKFTVEAFIPLAISTVFIALKNIRSDFFIKNRMYVSMTTFLSMLNIYAASLISMSWFFRNFYWTPILSTITILMMISLIKNQLNKVISIAIYSICMFSISLLSNWTSELLKLSYPY